MAAVFRELVLHWKGKEYRVKPTMSLLNRIEQDFSLARLASRIASDDAPLTQLATAISHFLKFAGARASAEDVYVELMNGDKEIVSQMAHAIMLAIFPETGKKEAAPPKEGTDSEKSQES